ncbi:MAG: hypothetical protein ACWA42_01415 [Lutibacter sp.]
MFSIFKKKKSQQPIFKISDYPDIKLDVIPKIASNEFNDLYMEIDELGGFPFIKMIILGNLYTKIKKEGATCQINLKNNEVINLNAEHNEIESEEIKNTPFFYTAVDFAISEDEVKTVQSENIISVQFNFKAENLSFNTIIHNTES